MKFRTSALFTCHDCGKEWQDHNTARQLAYSHAKRSGHFVRGEIGTAYHYSFKNPFTSRIKLVKKLTNKTP